MMASRLNTEPLTLRHSSSLATDDKLMTMLGLDQISFPDDSDDDDNEAPIVPQHLDPEQYSYEFPPRSRLEALAYLDGDDSFFDESSFTTTTTSFAYSSYRPIDDDDDDDDDHMARYWSHENDDLLLVDDNHLSPLQLPAQRTREQSCDSTTTVTEIRLSRQQNATTTAVVGPSSFLSPYRDSAGGHGMKKPDLSGLDSDDDDLPVFRNESVPVLDDDDDDITTIDSDLHSDSKVVLIRLSKSSRMDRPSCLVSDEGYDDEEYDNGDEPPIESASVFLPLSEDPREAAATKIQALWRSYKFRKQHGAPPATRVLAGLARICAQLHKQAMTRLEKRIEMLERQLCQETAMRTAFEKATEDMTILIDQQQRAMYDRVEQEMSMRQHYEYKVELALAQSQPLEARLLSETKARIDLENTLAQVLQWQQQQAKEEAEARSLLQRKLDRALQEIDSLKKQRSSSSSSAARRSGTPLSRTSTRPPSTATTTTTASTTNSIHSNTTSTTRRTMVPATSRTPTRKRTTAVPRTNNTQSVKRIIDKR